MMISVHGRVHTVGSLRVLLADRLRLLFLAESEFKDLDLFAPREDERRDLLLDVCGLLPRDELVLAF